MGQPRPVQLPDGTTSTTPSAHLDFEVNKYTALWCPTDQHEDITEVAHPELLDPEVKYIIADSFPSCLCGVLHEYFIDIRWVPCDPLEASQPRGHRGNGLIPPVVLRARIYANTVLG